VAAEAEGVVDDHVHRHFPRGVRHVIQVAFGIGILQVDGRGNDAVFDGQRARGHFHRAGGAEHVAGGAFGGAYDQPLGVVAENGFDGLRFADVALWGGGAVGVDVIHVGQVQPAGAQRHFHAARRAFAAGGRCG